MNLMTPSMIINRSGDHVQSENWGHISSYVDYDCFGIRINFAIEKRASNGYGDADVCSNLGQSTTEHYIALERATAQTTDAIIDVWR